MESKLLLVLVVGLIIGLAIGFVVISSVELLSPKATVIISDKDAGQLVLDLLNANDINATLLSIEDESDVYKITVKADAVNVTNEFYVTRDGAMLFQPGVIGIKQMTESLLVKRNFFECMKAKGLKFYGSTEINATLLQLQVFGGPQFVDRIYVPCESASAQACIDANITEVPTFVFENVSYVGAKPIDWFVNLTNCTLM